MSADALTNPHKLLILIHGSGNVRAGQWSRRWVGARLWTVTLVQDKTPMDKTPGAVMNKMDKIPKAVNIFSQVLVQR